MVTLKQIISWARANRKSSLALVVIGLVLLALIHPGTRNIRAYTAEVGSYVEQVLLHFHCLLRHSICR